MLKSIAVTVVPDAAAAAAAALYYDTRCTQARYLIRHREKITGLTMRN